MYFSSNITRFFIHKHKSNFSFSSDITFLCCLNPIASDCTLRWHDKAILWKKLDVWQDTAFAVNTTPNLFHLLIPSSTFITPNDGEYYLQAKSHFSFLLIHSIYIIQRARWFLFCANLRYFTHQSYLHAIRQYKSHTINCIYSHNFFYFCINVQPPLVALFDGFYILSDAKTILVRKFTALSLSLSLWS